MSYDLTLFIPPPGIDPLEAWHRIQREEEGFWAGACDTQEIANRLQSRVPGFFHTSVKTEDGFIELTHQAQVQVLVTDREIGITMPYFRKSVEPMLAVIRETIDCLAEAGFVVYDPQFNKIVTVADFGAMKDAYRDTDKVLPHIIRDAQKRREARKPWWKFW